MDEPPHHAKELDDLLQALWVKNYPILLERLKLIRDATDKLDAGSLDKQARKDGEEAAHKLAGILGTFGLPRGSVLASKIEALLAGDAASCDKRAAELKSWLEELEAVIASRT
jgi:HPt (histidine-containing phosphotransfer) domain-containing protein